MAEEGEDSLDDERDIELSAISAIFPEIRVHGREATLDIQVAPAVPLPVRFIPEPTISALLAAKANLTASNLEDGPVAPIQHVPRPIHNIAHLPPLRLSMSLPDGYPGDKPPEFDLDSDHGWIPRSTLLRLEREGRSLWKDYGQGQVVYAYIDFLQQEAERSFGLCDGKEHTTLPPYLEAPLLSFDNQAKRQKFDQGTFECGICLEPKKGSTCHRLRGCGHVYCVSCLQDCYNSAITEGAVTSVRCPDPNCGKESLTVAQRRRKKPKTLNPAELLEIPIERSQVQRYVDMKLKRKFESDKTTIYCPRKWCQAPARSAKFAKYNAADLENFPDSDSESEEEPKPLPEDEEKTSLETDVATRTTASDRLAICSKCSYAFCCVCQKSWHGEFLNCLPGPEVEMSAEEKASYDFIRWHTTPCPYCNTPCQKSMGCNHMQCRTCATHFCYLCSAWLDGENPYAHFNTQYRPCYQRLFELELGDEGNVGHLEEGGGANRPEVPDGQRAVQGLHRFLVMAADDIEDEWDSDEIEEVEAFHL